MGRGQFSPKNSKWPKILSIDFFSVVQKCRHAFLVADTQLYSMPCQSVHRFICPSIGHIFELPAVFALLPLPSHPRQCYCISGFVISKRLALHLLALLVNPLVGWSHLSIQPYSASLLLSPTQVSNCSTKSLPLPIHMWLRLPRIRLCVFVLY